MSHHFAITSLMLSVLACETGCSSTTPVAPDAATTSDASAGSDAAATSDAAASNNDAGSPDASATGYCAVQASRQACPGAGAETPCSTQRKCLFDKMVPAGQSAFAACFSAPSCKGEDACLAAAGTAVAPTESGKYATDCTDRRSACSNSFADDYCSPSAFAWPTAGSAVVACLQKDCAEIATCMKAVEDTIETCP